MDKTPRTAETTVPPAKPPAARPAARVRRTSRLQTLGLVGAAVLVIAALAFLRRSDTDIATDNVSGRAEPAVDASSSRPASAQPPTAASAAEAAAAGTSIVKAPSKKARAAKLEKDRTARLAASPARPIASMKSTADASAKADAATMPVASESPAAPATPVSASSETLGPAPVTITGCLEVSVDHSEFRLTDTDGVYAPKARSWRTGFLKKRSAAVALIEPPDPRGLQKQVGKRVAATGLLASNEMKVKSLQVVGSSCN
jgi:hypothetical protein